MQRVLSKLAVLPVELLVAPRELPAVPVAELPVAPRGLLAVEAARRFLVAAAALRFLSLRQEVLRVLPGAQPAVLPGARSQLAQGAVRLPSPAMRADTPAMRVCPVEVALVERAASCC